MTTTRLLALSLLLFLTLGTAAFAAAPAPIVTPYFSVTPPAGWALKNTAANDNDQKRISFEKSKDKIYALISIACGLTKSKLSLNEAWGKIKPFMFRNKKILFAGEEKINGITWKKVHSKDGSVESLIYFTIINDRKYKPKTMAMTASWA